MSSKQVTVDKIVNKISSAGIIVAKKMFGECAIYCNGRIVALVCDDKLFVKPTAQGKDFMIKFTEKAPYEGAKLCLYISAKKQEDAEWLSKLIQITAENLPLPKKK